MLELDMYIYSLSIKVPVISKWYSEIFALPSLLFIPSALLHARQVTFSLLALQPPVVLKTLDQCFAYGLWHLAGRAADIYYAALLVECIVDSGAVLTNQVLDVDLLPLPQCISEKFSLVGKVMLT
jgi:hypothetical protein